MGNLILIAYLLTAIVLLPDLSFMVVRHWISQPIPATAVALLVISLFWPRTCWRDRGRNPRPRPAGPAARARTG
ncbi:MAG: hypothetical protein ACKOUT_05020 [Novosphingobium sp.]